MDIKQKFIFEQVITNSLQAGLATRNRDNRIYNRIKAEKPTQSEKQHNKLVEQKSIKLKNRIAEVLGEIYDNTKATKLEEEELIVKIKDLSETISNEFSDILLDGKFRIGVSQKIINLFLKYLWCLGWIQTPPHCPIDGQIKDKINYLSPHIILISWTELDSIEEYLMYISAIKSIISNTKLDISSWELNEWQSTIST